MPKPFANALRLAISLGLIGALLWVARDHMARIGALLVQVRPSWLSLALAGYLAVNGILGIRLQQVLGALGVMLPLPLLIRLSFIGMFFNNFLPTSTGGDVVKAYYIGRSADVAWIAWVGVVVDRALGSATFLLLALMALVTRPNDQLLGRIGWWYVAAGLCVGCVVIGAMVWARGMLRRGGAPAWCVRLQPLLVLMDQRSRVLGRMGLAAIWSLATQLLGVVAMLCLSRSLGLPIGLMELLLVMPLVAAASMVPSINGLGVRESALVLCLERSVGRDSALALALLLLAMLIAISLVGGVLYAVQGGRMKLALGASTAAKCAG